MTVNKVNTHRDRQTEKGTKGGHPWPGKTITKSSSTSNGNYYNK